MARPESGADRAAVLRDAEAIGVDATCERHGVSRRTVMRWRARERERVASASRSQVGPAAVAMASVARVVVSGGWTSALDAAFCAIARRAVEIASEAGPDDLRVVCEAAVKLGTILSEREIMRAELDHGGANGVDRSDAGAASPGQVPPHESPRD